MSLALNWGTVHSYTSNVTRDMIKKLKIWFFKKCQICNFFKKKFCQFFSGLWSYLWSYVTYRSVLYLKSKLKTCPFDLIFSVFWLQSKFYKVGSNEDVLFFWRKLYECKKLQNLTLFEISIFQIFHYISDHIWPTGV